MASVIRVAPGGAASGACGTDWSTPCDLQYALGTLAVVEDELWVHAGTHYPGADNLSTFQLRSGVALYGGFAGSETLRTERNWVTNVTTLSGDIGTPGDATDNVDHVVTGSGTDATAILDGFTISGGDGNNPCCNSGAGLVISSGNPSISNCVFSGNSTYAGGAVSTGSGSPTFTFCTFSGNSAGVGGAASTGDGTPTFSFCTFSGNSASGGGGAVYGSGTFSSCTFSGNSAGSGGAVSSSGGTYTSCTFNGNSALDGGAVAMRGGSITFNGCTFSGNSATNGGALSALGSGSAGMFANCTFSGNTATVNGGALVTGGWDSCIFANCTINGNYALGFGGAFFGYKNYVLRNCIVSGNSPDQFSAEGTNSTLSTSIVQGGCPAGSTCTDVQNVNPLLGALGSYGGSTKTMFLKAGSPAIDAGDDAICATPPVSNESQNGLTRPQGAHCDIGAFEAGKSTFRSLGTYDGWVLETGEASGSGGLRNPSSFLLQVGDDAQDRQYRGILAYDTAPLPNTAKILGASLRLRSAGVAGTNPFATHRGLVYDVRKGGFSNSNTLQSGDFQAPATKTAVGRVPATLRSGWYSSVLSPTACGAVNLAGQTQFRLRFERDDNDDRGADYLKLYSGNAAASFRPQLEVLYYLP